MFPSGGLRPLALARSLASPAGRAPLRRACPCLCSSDGLSVAFPPWRERPLAQLRGVRSACLPYRFRSVILLVTRRAQVKGQEGRRRSVRLCGASLCLSVSNVRRVGPGGASAEASSRPRPPVTAGCSGPIFAFRFVFGLLLIFRVPAPPLYLAMISERLNLTVWRLRPPDFKAQTPPAKFGFAFFMYSVLVSICRCPSPS